MQWNRLLAMSLLLFPLTTAGQGNLPDKNMIIHKTATLVAQHLGLSVDANFSEAFDLTYVQAQPEPGYWAVVGGFIAELRTDDVTPHNYIAGIRLICPQHQDAECWLMDKLAVDGTILLGADKLKE